MSVLSSSKTTFRRPRILGNRYAIDFKTTNDVDCDRVDLISNNMTIRWKNFVNAENEVSLCKITDRFWEVEEDGEESQRGTAASTTDTVERTLWMPRIVGIQEFGRPSYIRSTEGAMIDDSKFSTADFRLKPEQQASFDEMIRDYFSKTLLNVGAAGCVLQKPCGAGKTYDGIAMINHVRRRTLWITNTDISVRQTIRTIKKVFPSLVVIDGHECADFVIEGKGAKKSSPTDKADFDIVVSTVHPFVLDHTLMRKYPEQMKAFVDTIGLVIYDEIHVLAAPIFRRLFDIFSPRYQLGMTATPGERDDMMDLYYVTLVGPIFSPSIEEKKFPGVVHVIDYFNSETADYRKFIKIRGKKEGAIKEDEELSSDELDDSSSRTRGGMLNVSKTIGCITSDPKRMTLLLSLVAEALARYPDKGIIIFCNLHSEIEMVSRGLDEAIKNGAIPKVICGEVHGRTSPLAVFQAVNEAQIIVGNYQKLGTAFSEARFMTAIIWSSCKSRCKQAVGRITRWCPDEEQNEIVRHVYDFADRYTLAGSQFRFRAEVYKNLGWKCVAHVGA
jgi:type I site-specific restriction endonuclease